MDLSKFTFKRLISLTDTFQGYFDIKAEFGFLDEENKTNELLELRAYIKPSTEPLPTRADFENVNVLDFIKKYGFITLRTL